MNRDQLIAALQRDEGFKAHAYRDSEGYWTIGYGTLVDERLGGITKDEGAYLLGNRLDAVIEELNWALPWWKDLSPRRREALANMAYNLGVPRLLGFKKMLAHLKAGEWQDAAREALDSKWARQVGARAKRIADAIREG